MCKRWSAIVLLAVAAEILCSAQASADIVEWVLRDPGMRRRASDALTRYYSIVRPDSLRVRYLSRNGAVLPWLLRAERTGNDTLGQLVSIGLGQLTLASPGNIRIAVGEDLYHSLLVSRTGPDVSVPAVASEKSTSIDWGNRRVLSIAIDQAEYRVAPDIAAFVSAGAAESNLFFWADGTARAGVASPNSEFAVLFPFGAGATAVGPLRTRKLAPGYGAAAAARYGPLSARTRFTAVSGVALRAAPEVETPYVHTLTFQLSYEGSVASSAANLTYSAGLGFEEFAGVRSDTAGAAVVISRVRRVSPLAEIAYRTPGRNFRFSLGITDLALRGSLLAQLSEHLSVEVRWVSNTVFRSKSAFEHPFALFLTPRISL